MPEEVVDIPFLEVCKTKLDNTLGRLIWWVATLSMAQGWKQMGFKVSQTIPWFHDSIIAPNHCPGPASLVRWPVEKYPGLPWARQERTQENLPPGKQGWKMGPVRHSLYPMGSLSKWKHHQHLRWKQTNTLTVSECQKVKLIPVFWQICIILSSPVHVTLLLQRSNGCPILGHTQGQAEWNSRHLMKL